MANMTIKQIPEDVHEALRRDARHEGKSVNAYVIGLLRQAVEERRRRAVLRDRRDDFRRFMATLPGMSDSTELLREDRNQGHE